ncbi:MAG: glutamate--tRNA ligase [Actinobacteria bacterium]|nr:glutamate--tRNA ligase [Actinomycetota bacterium]
MTEVRTRIEPAPSGSIHVGNARTALFNWLFARHHGGVFVLRIADTDAKRATDENYRAVLEDFRWLGLDWDEGPEAGGAHGPYRQSERFDLYRTHAEKLVEGGFAYYDYASPEDVDAERKRAQAEGRRPDHRAIADARKEDGHAPSIRFIVPADQTITFHDEVLGEMSTDLGRTPDFVIVRADGSPTYMLAVTVDDLAMGITHVIRGNDLVASTARQLLIREALGVTDAPMLAHLPLLVSPDGKPLSKRWGDVAVGAYRDQGFLPEAMINYLALLGWSFDDRTNIFSVEDLVERFTLDRVGKNPAAFDVDKLEWLNGHYIRSKTPAELAELLVQYCVTEGIPADSPEGRRTLEAVTPLLVERMKRLTEAPPMVRFLFADVTPDDKAAKALGGQEEYLAAVADRLEALEKWTAAAIEEALRRLAAERELKPKRAFQPIRAAVTGTLVSPPLFESLEILGRPKTLERIRTRVG